MKTHDRLSHTWRELARRHGCETTRAEVVLDELLRAYSEPTRKYHTIEHIGSLLRKLDDHAMRWCWRCSSTMSSTIRGDTTKDWRAEH
jgi:predicted metal-dependent HD superfamily phosphohydrolase